jgi:hypothetical protein
LVVSSASGKRAVAGSVVAMSGVFTGVGRIVERPNRPGDSGKVSRDDLVFAVGTLHIRKRFAGASGTFTGSLSGSDVARRKADGSCDLQHPPLIEIDTVTGTGTVTF